MFLLCFDKLIFMLKRQIKYSVYECEKKVVLYFRVVPTTCGICVVTPDFVGQKLIASMSRVSRVKCIG